MWSTLFGARCVLCHQGLPGTVGQRQLCRYCLPDLPWRQDEPACGSAHIDHQVVPLHYEGAARHWVMQAKRDGGLVAARLLGVLLAEAVMEAYGADRPMPELLVPVPLAARRLRLRGHNQALLIARPVARALKAKIDPGAVRRVRHTPILADLSAAERQRLVAGLFECRREMTGASVAIVDDVVTSGATADSLAASLKAAGAGTIHLWSATAARIGC
jgi:ComF family protein